MSGFLMLDHARLAGRRALVTGASRRLGRATATRLAQAGVHVAVHYRSDREGADETVATLRALGVEAAALQADLTVPDACADLVDAAVGALGGIDILVNNAAIFERGTLRTMDVADFDRHMAANGRAVYALSLAAGRRMHAAHAADPGYEGNIVNMSDVAAGRPWAGYVAYSASKAAVSNLTAGFARLLAPAVRVNAVAPGPVLPPAGESEAQGQAAVRGTLLQRWGASEDITEAIAFLLRARYVTGVVLHVDGGRSIN